MGFSWGDYGVLRSGREVATRTPQRVSRPDLSALNGAAAHPVGALRGSPAGIVCDDRSDPTVAAPLSASAVRWSPQEAPPGVTAAAGALSCLLPDVAGEEA